MKIKKDNYAISEMLGTVLLLLIAVSSFAVVQANILLNPISQDQTYVTIKGDVKGNNIILLHRGGEPLSLKTKIKFEIDGNAYNIIIGENNYLTSEFKADGLWNIGESLVFIPGFDLTNLDVKVIVFDVETNTVLMSETI
jgi:hypothetical protein